MKARGFSGSLEVEASRRAALDTDGTGQAHRTPLQSLERTGVVYVFHVQLELLQLLALPGGAARSYMLLTSWEPDSAVPRA